MYSCTSELRFVAGMLAHQLCAYCCKRPNLLALHSKGMVLTLLVGPHCWRVEAPAQHMGFASVCPKRVCVSLIRAKYANGVETEPSVPFGTILSCPPLVCLAAASEYDSDEH